MEIIPLKLKLARRDDLLDLLGGENLKLNDSVKAMGCLTRSGGLV